MIWYNASKMRMLTPQLDVLPKPYDKCEQATLRYQEKKFRPHNRQEKGRVRIDLCIYYELGINVHQ